jgi:hypothetical protein
MPVVNGMALPLTVLSVKGRVLDPNGAPIPKLLAQVCGTNLCINGTTDATGTALVDVGNKMLTNPAFKYGEGYKFARFAAPLPKGGAYEFADDNTTAALPAQGAAFTPGQDAVSGGVTLSIPAGGVVNVDTLNYDMPDMQLFRAVEIPIAKAGPAVDKSLNLEILYGAGPIETTLCPAAAVSVPNTPNWPAGTAVEFFVHGVDVSEIYAPYGGWAKVSDGVVSADAKAVVTAKGGGLPIVSAFGVRKKM